MRTLEKIRAEIAEFKDEIAELPNMADAYAAVKHCLVIIDKYASEECDNDCEHCAYLECPKVDLDFFPSSKKFEEEK